MLTRLTGTYNPIDNSFWLDFSIDGHRVTWTVNDLQRGYAHSHLSASRPYYNGYCTGHGEIFSTLSEINPSREELQFVLLSLDTFVSWESLEGGPYHTFGAYNNAKPFIIKDRFDPMYNGNTSTQTGLIANIPFEKLAPAYKIMRKDGETKYILDEKLFMKIVVEELKGSDIVRSYNIFYDQDKEWFYRDDNRFYNLSRTGLSGKSLKEHRIKTAKSRAETVPDTYINGVFHKSRLDENDPIFLEEESDDDDRYIQTVNPKNIIYVAYRYLGQLNKQLKDAKKKQNEE
jgi:hypothetical protein